MASFEFKKNTVDLKINGNEFVISLTNDVIVACDRLKYEAENFVKTLSVANDAETAKRTLVQICDSLAKGIDDILGEGSTEKIYGDKIITLLSLTDIVVFIRGEIMAAIETKIKEYGEPNK